MTTRKYSSRSQQTTLTAGINSSDTLLSVVSGSAILGGVTVPAGTTFTVVVDPDTALEEILDVTATGTNTLTVTRAIDGSTAQAHSAGAVVRHMAIGRDYRESNEHIENTTTAHGVTFANLVKTTDTGTVTSTMIVDGTIVNADINASAAIVDTKLATISTASKVSNSATTATSANTNSAIVARDSSGNFAAGTITATLTGNVTGNVTGTVSGNAGTVTNGVYTTDTGTVTSTMIANGTIVDADINSSAAITKTKISGTAITAADTGTVTSTMIANDTILNADISATAAIAKTKLDLGGTITSADLVDGTIVNADINASAAIALSKLAVDPLARVNHTGTQTASTVSDFDTQVRTSRLDQMAAPTAAVALNAQKLTGVANPTNQQDAVTLNYIDGQKGAVNGIAPLDGTGKIPLDHIPASAIADTFVVNSQSAMLATAAGVGDIAVRTDLNKSFILQSTPPTTLGNWIELLTPTDAVLSVDGVTGAVSLSGTYLNKTTGVLAGNLDAGTFTVTNLATPSANSDAATKVYVDTVAGSATAAAASAAAAATTYDNFDDRYLGAKATAPTLDNDGNTLLVGAIYWNSSTNAMYAWTGTEWGSISSTADIFRFRFTASGGETSESGLDDNGLTLAYIPGKEQVYLNGVLLARTSDYNATNGSSITGLAALSAGDILEIITFTAFELVDSIARSLFDAKGDILVATSADTPGKLTVGTNGHYLKANSATATGLEWAAVPNPDLTPYATNASVEDNLILTLMGAI